MKRELREHLFVLRLFLLTGVILALFGPELGHAKYAGVDPGSEGGVELAENILAWQSASGGWDKNIDFTRVTWEPGMPRGPLNEAGVEVGTIDNGASVDEMRYLAAVYQATGQERFKEGFVRGLDWLLDAQYPQGGWPQVYPARGGYWDYVTYNDGAMINVLRFLQEISGLPERYGFLEESYGRRIEAAVGRGVDYILRSQIEVEGRLTAWGQQHHPVTYEPMPGRAFEPPAISAAESAAVVEFLHSLPNPTPEVRRAMLSAIEWLKEVRQSDGRWARLYEIGTNRPIFAGRDAVVRYDIAEIEAERRDGYAWYGTWPADLTGDDRLAVDLYESLESFPAPLLIIRSPRTQEAPYRGSIPLDVEVRMGEHLSLDRVEILLDGEPIYAGPSAPAPGSLALSALDVKSGRHRLVVAVTYEGVGQLRKPVDFTVVNSWRLHDEMLPPLDAGWFGVTERLRTRDRSSGWIHVSADPDRFFEDASRLSRSADTQEYLVWETPSLQRAEVTLFVRAGLDWVSGVAIHTSPDGEAWVPQAFRTHEVTQAGEWAHVRLTLEVEGTEGRAGRPNFLRVRVGPRIPADALQIGAVVMEGLLLE